MTMNAADRKFDRLTKALFDACVRRNPLLATSLGVHDHDGKLPDGRRKARLREIADHHRFLDRFQAFPREGLSRERRVDRDLAVHFLRLWVFEAEELRFWESSPEGPNAVADGLFSLFIRDFAPLPERLRSITQRLAAAPRYLQQTRSALVDPVRLWVEMAIEVADEFPGLVAEVRTAAQACLGEREMLRLDRAAASAESAMKAHAAWLKGQLDVSRTDFAVGRTKFARMLKLRELGVGTREVLAFGRRMVSRHQEELARLARNVRPNAEVREVRDLLKANHPPTFEGVLTFVRDAVARSRRFVDESGYATIPPGEDLKVIETPGFLRNVLPFGAYSAPARLDERQHGLYFVTPVDGNNDRLKKHNYSSLANMTVHEGYPGHHLQIVCANRHPSLLRALTWAVETCEGWAHYCEERLKELGFGDTPEERFVQGDDALWRAVRVIVDVQLSCGDMTFEQAVEFMGETAGMDREAAIAEVKRYTITPGYQLSYMFGRERIKALR
ncbi:MAG: DUF885 domain-containing protein, partial [Planctomycetota bacterium]